MKKIYILEDYATSKEVPIIFKLTDGSDNTLHMHSFVEIFYITSGSIKHKLDNGPCKTLQCGNAVLILPSHKHEFLRESNTVCAHRDIMIREEMFKQACNYLDSSLYNKFMSGIIPCEYEFTPTQITQFEHTITAINQMLPTNINERTLKLRAFAISLIEPFVSVNTTSKEFPAWFKQLVSSFNAITYLKEGLHKITEPFNYDKKYLCRVFKKYMGMTMTEYLNHMRLDYALVMIQGSNNTILEIAQSLGFSTISHFNVLFKKRYGITPLQARKN